MKKKIVPEICPPMVRLAWVQLELAPACRSLLLGQSLRLGEERLAGGTDGFAGDMSVRRDAEFSSVVPSGRRGEVADDFVRLCAWLVSVRASLCFHCSCCLLLCDSVGWTPCVDVSRCCCPLLCPFGPLDLLAELRPPLLRGELAPCDSSLWSLPFPLSE